MGSGKSSVATRLIADGWSLFQIDQSYQSTARTDVSIAWFEDEHFKRRAYGALRRDVLDAVRNGRHVVIETTGASSHASALVKALKRRKELTTLVICVNASLKKARARIRLRNKSPYPIKCPASFVDVVAEGLERVSLPIDFNVNGNASLQAVRREVRSILKTWTHRSTSLTISRRRAAPFHQGCTRAFRQC